VTSVRDLEPAATFAELLMRRADDDRLALRLEDDSWTWRELLAASRARAAVMIARQTRRPDSQLHVGILLENTMEYVAWIYGAALARATVVGINPTRRGNALRDDIRHTDCGLIVTATDQHDLIADLDLGLSAGSTLLVDRPGYADELAAASDLDVEAQRPEPTDLLLLLFTSGSTGAPKAVVCTSGRLAGTATGAVVNLGILPEDVFYQAMPLFHGNAIMASLAPAVALAAPVALRRRFSASGFLPDVRRFDATYFNYVGRSLAYVLATPEAPDDRDNVLRLGFGTEASLRDRAEFSRRFGCDLLESYGSSEGVISTYRPPGAPEASVGLPQPRPGTDVAVVNPQTLQECPPAEFDATGRILNGDSAIGEIVDRGGAIGFEGYYRNDEAMADRLRDGWYWSGDLAYRDADGYLYFAGRSNDWLRVDSENFASAPVEAVLSRHPDVVMVAVYATPDPRTGDQVMAALELRPGASFDPAGFAEFLAGQADLGTKWAPHFVRLIDTMPLTATNKVDKAPLRRVGWEVTDPVFTRLGPDPRYVEFTAADRAAYRTQFGIHLRQSLLPPPLSD
jgi:fatty-acyl-CoA synthase